MTKAEARKHSKALLSQLSEEQVNEYSTKIANALLAQPFISGNDTVHIFLPMNKQNEVNTWLIISRLRRVLPNVRLVVPVSDFSHKTMQNALLLPDETLIMNEYGIPEPLTPVFLTNHNIDVILLPLLAFDEAGNRVGFGKGFYDRFIPQCRPEVKKIALSLLPAKDELISDLNEYDIPLNACITPDKTFIF